MITIKADVTIHVAEDSKVLGQINSKLDELLKRTPTDADIAAIKNIASIVNKSADKLKTAVEENTP